MKGYYIYISESDFRADKRPLTGVEKKILMQVKAFHEAGLGGELIIAIHRLGGLWNKISSRLPFGNDHIDWPEVDQLLDADWIYFRKPYLMAYGFREFLKSLRNTVPHAKILLELPTYPYDTEAINSGWQYYPWLWREQYNRVRLQGLIDRIVLVGRPERELWRIPTLLIGNGIDPDTIPLRTPRSQGRTVRVLCAANFTRAHGIDRFLEGMQRYYGSGGKREIQLELAGEGPEYHNLISQVEQSACLKGRVVFHGILDGDQLSGLYDRCDLAISTLGGFRFGLKYSSALKTREYMAAGIPFLTDIPIDILSQKENFVLRVPMEETPIDIETVLAYYDSLYPDDTLSEKKQIAYRIRQQTIERIRMANTMKETFEYLKDE